MSNANNQHPTLTGAEILWASLDGEGTTTVFGYPGGAILPIYDAVRKHPNKSATRLATFVAPAPRYKRGVFFKYANSVSSASQGAVTT